MKLKISYLILFTLIVNILSANATIRYVSKTGTSTPPYTSWESAADSIQKCINICVDGDTIYVANGVYKENLVINTAISFIGSSMDSTVIDGRGLGIYTISTNTYNSYGSIENFNIYGKGQNADVAWCFSLQNDSFKIINCQLSQAALGIGADANIFAENLVLKNLRVRGFSLFGDNFNIINNCLLFFDGEYAKGIDIGFTPNGIYELNNNILLNTSTNHVNDLGIYCGFPKKVYISNNLISGFGVNIYIDGVEDTIFIKNNLLTNSGAGITADRISIANNVVLINNNIGIDNHSVSNKFNYNIYWKNNHNFSTITTYGDSDKVADPMFVKDTIPTVDGKYDFHLQAFSPGIDKGDPSILDVDGSRSDIGMYGGPFGETYTYQDLAPLAPRNLTALVDSNTILVKWNKNTEADTSFYKVYRDTVSGFTIDSTKLVSSSADTFFIQPNPHINTRYVYKVSCVDNQGNESQPSAELVVNITSVSTNDYPMTISDYVLYQNYPNPFNPSTKIGYQLKEKSYVKLIVYDIKGELVSVLVNKEQSAGYYEVEFVGNGLPSIPNTPGLASGIYLYRIEIIGEGKIPIYSEMKKMLLIK